MRILLLLSLAINIFLIGVFAGGKFHYRQMPPPPTPSEIAEKGDWMLMPFRHIRQLPPAHREQARAIMEQKLPELRRIQRELQKARNAQIQALSDGNYKSEEFLRDAKKIHELQGQQMQLASQALIEFLDSLPEEERAALLLQMEERRKHHHEMMQRRTLDHDKMMPSPPQK
ncbi:MAG: periplasmic heavy metal sensor [bacterium]